MKTHEWQYLINQFLNCTKKNFKKAVKLSRFHDAQLFAKMTANPGDADYLLAYNRYHLLHLALEAAYATWDSLGGTQEGSTLNVKQLLKLKAAKLDKIINLVEAVYLPDTPRFKAIFPDLRKPFRGSKSEIIAGFKALGLSMNGDLPIAAAKTIVDDYYTLLNTANTSQTGSKGAVTTASANVETARVNAMNGQYQNLGLFINKYPTAPKYIGVLFDVETITNPAQVIWKGHLDPLELHQVLVHTFMDGDLMRVKSVGSAPVLVYLASTPGGTDSTSVEIEALKELKFDVTLFGVTDYSVNRYLTIVNKSDTIETRFMVELY